MSVLRLFVLRHGETDSSRSRRFTGTRDVELTELGRRQMQAAAVAIPTPLHAVYASPLARTRGSAELIAAHHGLAVRLDPRFIEMSFGRWEGLTRDEALALTPEVYGDWRRAPHAVTPPGGEALPGVAARVAEGLAELKARHPDETVVLVTHAIIIRLLVLSAMGLDPDRLWSVDASPGGLTEIEYRADWVTVHRMNTLSHLETVGAPHGVADPARA